MPCCAVRASSALPHVCVLRCSKRDANSPGTYSTERGEDRGKFIICRDEARNANSNIWLFDFTVCSRNPSSAGLCLTHIRTTSGKEGGLVRRCISAHTFAEERPLVWRQVNRLLTFCWACGLVGVPGCYPVHVLLCPWVPSRFSSFLFFSSSRTLLPSLPPCPLPSPLLSSFQC